MKIKFTVTADFEAEVTEDVAYEVMKDYGGNFDAWMEDNYSDYTCESEFEVEDISYDKKEAAKTLSIIRKHIDEKGDTFLKSNLRSRLRNSKFPTAHIPALENMQKLEIDLELMEKIFEFADFNNPKEELNFIYLNGEYAEATNSRIVIRHKHKFNFENKIHFPPFFIEPMKDDAEVYVFENNQLFMKYKDGKKRCRWTNPKSQAYIEYHDKEWGMPVHDDHKLFEMLILESFQAGLSWECVLNKREAFREAFDGFDVHK